MIAALFRPTPRLLAFCGGFAGAVMVTVSLADLAPSVMEFYGQSLSPLGCGFAVTGLLLGGMRTALFLGKALPGEETLAARFGSRAQGAAMRKETLSPNHFRYRCNDGHVNDDFTDIIFDLILE